MRQSHYIFAFACLVGCSVLGCSAEKEKGVVQRPASVQPDVEQVAKSYRSMRAMTKSPAAVDLRLATLCAPSVQPVEAARVSDPDAQAAVRIFMNDAAAKAFAEHRGAYPVGSIVVKEKQAFGNHAVGHPGGWLNAEAGVGGMIKRSPGYDPEHGDWEYFYLENAGKIEHGRIDSCVQCHSGAAETGNVYGGWANRL